MNLRQVKLKITPLVLLMVLAIAMLSSCTKNSVLEPEREEQHKSEREISFRVDLANEPLSSLAVYHFNGGILQKIDRNIAIVDNQFSVYAVSGYTIYLFANLFETEEMKALQTGVSTLDEFLTLRSAATESEDIPMFYSGSYQVPKIAPSPITVQLYRNVAALDLNTSRDERINVTRIVIDDASANSTIFPGEQISTPTTQKVTYDKVYNPGITSTGAIQYIHESSRPLKITVYANFHDIPQIVKLSIPQVKRNFRYSIKLEGVGANITGQLQIVPWGTGDDATGSPDETGAINLSDAHSTLVDGISIDGQAISVSEKGGEFTLGFTSDIAVDSKQLEGGGENITIAEDRTEIADGQVISYFRVNIKAQGKGRLPYRATLRMKRASQEHSYDNFEINVDGSEFQIAEVTLGGVTWMAFNATTPRLEDQIYPLDGASVEETYRLNWGSTIGSLFQWGRIHNYTPWASGSHNAGNQSQNNPWVSSTHVPCPSGYRIPTKAEMRALLPPNTRFPGATYAYNGDSITATFVYHGTVQLGNVQGTARSLILTSKTTGAALYLPLSGQKGDKSTTNNPEFGRGFTLWTTQNHGAAGGWAWVGKYWPGTGESATIEADSQLQAEGYAYVRCIKN